MKRQRDPLVPMMPVPQCLHGNAWNNCASCGTTPRQKARALAREFAPVHIGFIVTGGEGRFS